MVGDAPVMARKPHVPIPARGGLEVARALGQALQALVLIDLDAEAQLGNLERSQASVRVVEPIGQGELSGGRDGDRRTDAICICGRIVGAPGTAGRAAHHKARGQRDPRPVRVGFRAAEGGREQGRVLAAVNIVGLGGSVAHHRHLLHRGGWGEHGVYWCFNLIFQGRGRHRHRRRQRHNHRSHHEQLLHIPSSPSAYSR
ncbi:hypothetical protein SDC9_154535 [bioreactor metagenome]|uniref:Uncharacterized protein n=1 Tax=bioreactor metagenome TaxID=1076179 RepID=A0A645F1F7_9ZZZZ